MSGAKRCGKVFKVFQKTFSDLKNNSFLAVSAIVIPVIVLIIYWRDLSILARTENDFVD